MANIPSAEGHGHNAVVVQLHQFPERAKDLDPQHEHDHEGPEFEVAVGHANGSPAEGHGRAAGYAEEW